MKIFKGGVIFIVALMFIGCSNDEDDSVKPTATTVEGTVWETVSYLREIAGTGAAGEDMKEECSTKAELQEIGHYYLFEFLAKGSLRVSDGEYDYEGTWEQKGDSLFIDFEATHYYTAFSDGFWTEVQGGEFSNGVINQTVIRFGKVSDVDLGEEPAGDEEEESNFISVKNTRWEVVYAAAYISGVEVYECDTQEELEEETEYHIMQFLEDGRFVLLEGGTETVGIWVQENDRVTITAEERNGIYIMLNEQLVVDESFDELNFRVVYRYNQL